MLTIISKTYQINNYNNIKNEIKNSDYNKFKNQTNFLKLSASIV